MLGVFIQRSEHRNILVARQFESLICKYGKHSTYSEDGTWYQHACNVLGLKHYLHSPYEKNVVKRVNF